MRSAGWSLLAATIAVAGYGPLSGLWAADEPRPVADARPGSVLTESPVAPSVVGKSLSPGEPLNGERRRITQGDDPVPADTNPVPASGGQASDTPAYIPPPLPFGGPAGRSGMHQRLRARRLARIQQMRQSAEQNGDTQGVERAQYLEGMVNELHNQGLFNFAQKVMGAMQEGKLQGAAAGAGASTGAVEMPDADLGSSAPLPDADLGESAPLPGVIDDAPPESN